MTVMGIKNSTFLTKAVAITPLVVFRVGFGLVMMATIIRFVAKGWVDAFYIAPSFHFTYWGWAWVKPLPAFGMYVVFFFLGLFAFCITLGLFYRFSCLAFWLLFSYVELLDKALYLNHYYFISLLSFLLIFMPLNRAWSVDVWLGRVARWEVVPAFYPNLIRLQFGLVYFYAGIAKLNPDWLLHALPLKIWLPAHTQLPFIGFLFDQPWVAYLMSWTGAAFDLTIPFWLSWRKSRLPAYLVLTLFHTITGLLFPIGVFPWLMSIGSLIFFDFAHPPQPSLLPIRSQPSPLFRWAIVGFFTFQVLFPLRHWLYPGNDHWSNEGFRFAWKVMVVEKTGDTTFHLTDPDTGQNWTVYPDDYLTIWQVKQMAFQPDMILEFAHHLAQQFRSQGYPHIEVRVTAYSSLNGRSSRLLIDPTANLVTYSPSLAPQTWILP